MKLQQLHESASFLTDPKEIFKWMEEHVQGADFLIKKGDDWIICDKETKTAIETGKYHALVGEEVEFNLGYYYAGKTGILSQSYFNIRSHQVDNIPLQFVEIYGDCSIELPKLTNLDWLPEKISGTLALDEVEDLASFKGISRRLKQVNQIRLPQGIEGKPITGCLELAMIEYRPIENTADPIMASKFSPLGNLQLYAVARLLKMHIKKHGRNNILDLRKMFIDRKLEAFI